MWKRQLHVKNYTRLSLASGVGDLHLKGSLYGREVIVNLGRSEMVSL